MADEPLSVTLVGPTHPHPGGITHYTASLANALAAQPATRVRVESYHTLFPRLLYRGEPAKETAIPLRDDIPVARDLTYGNALTWGKVGRRAGESRVVHFQTWTPFLSPSMLGVARAARKRGAKLVATLHNIVPHERAHRVAMPAHGVLMRQMDALIVHAESLRQKCADTFSVDLDKVHVVPHGVYDHFTANPITREEARAKLGLSDKDKAILQFGIIRDYKGLDITIDALAKLPEEYKLIIAGQAWNAWPQYQAQIERLGLAHRVKATIGYIPDSDVALYFRAADVAVYPYRNLEAQSGAALTAVAFGVPVVATEVGGLGELASASMPRADASGLAKAVVELPRTPTASRAAPWSEAAKRTLLLYTERESPTS